MNFDGKEYPEKGPTVTEGSTSSGHRIDERTIETTEKIKGKVIEVAKATISQDGRNTYDCGERTGRQGSDCAGI